MTLGKLKSSGVSGHLYANSVGHLFSGVSTPSIDPCDYASLRFILAGITVGTQPFGSPYSVENLVPSPLVAPKVGPCTFGGAIGTADIYENGLPIEVGIPISLELSGGLLSAYLAGGVGTLHLFHNHLPVVGSNNNEFTDWFNIFDVTQYGVGGTITLEEP